MAKLGCIKTKACIARMNHRENRCPSIRKDILGIQWTHSAVSIGDRKSEDVDKSRHVRRHLCAVPLNVDP